MTSLISSQDTVKQHLIAAGAPSNLVITIAGLSNEYSQYTSTPEEYGKHFIYLATTIIYASDAEIRSCIDPLWPASIRRLPARIFKPRNGSRDQFSSRSWSSTYWLDFEVGTEDILLYT